MHVCIHCLILGIHVGAAREEHPHHAEVPAFRGRSERRCSSLSWRHDGGGCKESVKGGAGSPTPPKKAIAQSFVLQKRLDHKQEDRIRPRRPKLKHLYSRLQIIHKAPKLGPQLSFCRLS